MLFKIISNKFLVKVVGVFDCFIRPAALISFSITWLLKEQPLLFVQYNKMTDCIKKWCSQTAITLWCFAFVCWGPCEWAFFLSFFFPDFLYYWVVLSKVVLNGFTSYYNTRYHLTFDHCIVCSLRWQCKFINWIHKLNVVDVMIVYYFCDVTHTIHKP